MKMKKLKIIKYIQMIPKTENIEVIKNIEDISNSIYQNSKIKFEYWKYAITKQA